MTTDILDIANYQVASHDMVAIPLDKDFLKKENDPALKETGWEK